MFAGLVIFEFLIIILKIFIEKYFFKGKDFEDMLVLISEVLGTDDLFAYLEKY